MDHAKADNEGRPLQPGSAPPLSRRRLLLAGGVAMASGLLCALVLLNVVSAEQASAVAVIVASGTASVRAVFAGQQRGGTVIED
ncbi:hypothetical protein [Streptomyces sp. NPDC056255]|uniref:hypothetical protein n=1 Tax=Streptomyces sp. NPDC056255 TaxID=3345764 RepID=UPI0035DD4AA3